jgi:hypothetical protein
MSIRNRVAKPEWDTLCYGRARAYEPCQQLTLFEMMLKVRLPERIEHVNAFTRPSQHCEISQKSIRDWCSEIFWGTFLNLVTEFSDRSLQVLKTFAARHSAPFRKCENLTESQLRLMFRKFVCIPIKEASSALGDFLRISLNYHTSQNPNHQRPENITTVAPSTVPIWIF